LLLPSLDALKALTGGGEMNPSGGIACKQSTGAVVKCLVAPDRIAQRGPLMPKAKSIYFETTLHHRNTFPTDQHPGNPTISLLGSTLDRAAITIGRQSRNCTSK
jgi:hypothetical protein